MASPIQATGLGSNLDVNGLVDKLMEVEKQPLVVRFHPSVGLQQISFRDRRRIFFDGFRSLGVAVSGVKNLVQLQIKRLGYPFQSLDGWNGVAVLHTRNVTTEQSGSIFEVSLGESLGLTQLAQPVS